MLRLVYTNVPCAKFCVSYWEAIYKNIIKNYISFFYLMTWYVYVTL